MQIAAETSIAKSMHDAAIPDSSVIVPPCSLPSTRASSAIGRRKNPVPPRFLGSHRAERRRWGSARKDRAQPIRFRG